MNPTYYDGTTLLSKKDINGKTPEIYMVCGVRTGGKTTYFSRLLVNRFLNRREKFALLYRNQVDLDNVSCAFFNDIKQLFFPAHTMTHKMLGKGKYAELYLDDVPCAYAISINSADFIKKFSHLFTDVVCMFMDEFQSETNTYAPKEITKFISIHTSIARGHGEQVRYVPVYMCSNAVTLLNPYFVALGISDRLKTNTKFLRGDGYVLEQSDNESARDAQQQSAFNRAFKNSEYVAYASQNVYLNDNTSFIESLKGNNRYVCTVKYKNNLFSIKEYQRLGLLYVDTKYDLSFPQKLTLTTEDHNINYIMLANNNELVCRLRYFFNHGCFRFKNLMCKEMLLKMLSY